MCLGCSTETGCPGSDYVVSSFVLGLDFTKAFGMNLFNKEFYKTVNKADFETVIQYEIQMLVSLQAL